MRLLRALVLSLTVLLPHVLAQDFDVAGLPKEKHNYQVGNTTMIHNILIACPDIFRTSERCRTAPEDCHRQVSRCPVPIVALLTTLQSLLTQVGLLHILNANKYQPCIREIFLRELISNANDAIEKLRLTALTDKTVWDGENPLNITIRAIKDEDGKGGRIIITGTFVRYMSIMCSRLTLSFQIPVLA